MNMTSKLDILQKHTMTENGKIAIFGGGYYGKRLYKMLKVSKIEPDMFLDNNKLKWERSVIDGVVCKNPATMLSNADNILIIVAVKYHQEDIREDLLKRGYRHIILMSEVEKELEEKIEGLIDDSLIDLISYMAESGKGTDQCLAAGVYPMRVHFFNLYPI